MNNSLLPPNASALQLALEQVEAERLDALPLTIGDMWSPDDCPLELLPYLAWALSVDQWDGTWPEEVKREVIRQSVAVHRHKGTRGAVKRVLDAVGVDVEFTEWFETTPKGAPHTFELTASVNSNLAPINQNGGTEPVLNSNIFDLLKRMVNTAKRASSHYTFKTAAQFDSGLGVAGAMSVIKVARFDAASAPLDMPVATLGLAGALSATKIARFTTILTGEAN